jgi:HSP20 family protein
MEMKKWIPWNWFKKEEGDGSKTVPVLRQSSENPGQVLRDSMAHFHREVDRLFEEAFRGWGLPAADFSRLRLPGMKNGMLKPTLDLGATDTEYTLTVEIPGVDEKDIQLEVADDTLTVRGEKRLQNEEEGKSYYRIERSYGSFQRVLSLPEDADQNEITASFKNGLLSVTVPRKAIPASKVKRIEVKGA